MWSDVEGPKQQLFQDSDKFSVGPLKLFLENGLFCVTVCSMIPYIEFPTLKIVRIYFKITISVVGRWWQIIATYIT